MQPAPTITDPDTCIFSKSPLFPPDQVFLWIPERAGIEIAFCSCIEIPASGKARAQEPLHDGERYLDHTPDPRPSLPFHPIPINRFLTPNELHELAREVRQATGQSPMKLSHPLDVLRSENKCYILVFFDRMGLLSGVAPGRS